MMRRHMVPNSPGAPLCDSGCPVMDGGAIDAGGLVPNLAYATNVPRNIRPTFLMQNTPAASFDFFRFELGLGPLPLWTGGGGSNMCPFADVTWCTALSTMRQLAERFLTRDEAFDYAQLKASLGVYLPANKAIT